MDESLHERLPYASRAIGVLSAIAIKGYHIHLDQETPERWSAAMRAMRVTDSHADQPNDRERIQHLLDILISFDESFPELAAPRLGAERYSGMIRQAGAVIKYGEQLRNARTPEAYIDARRGEAHATAKIMSELATDHVQAQPAFSTGFVPAVNRLTTAAGFIDTAIDADRDYREGMLAFKPTPAFRVDLLRKGMSEFIPLAPILGHPNVIASFGHLAVQAIKSERLKA